MTPKTAGPATSWKPLAPSMTDQATAAAHAPKMGEDSNASMGMNVKDMMSRVPKLPTVVHPDISAAHVQNMSHSTHHFGTDGEKSKVKSDLMSNYGKSDGDCPSY